MTHISDRAKAIQRRALLEALQTGPVSTIEAREGLGISHPSGRVYELRRLGWAIETRTQTGQDAQGRLHRCAMYVLRQEGAQ